MHGLRELIYPGKRVLNEGVRILSRGKTSELYQIRIADREEDVRAAQMLRFQVFNLELNEGLEESFHTLLDSDPFDAVCDHLLVEEVKTGEIIGTYRLQTGATAAANLGYYSEQEFDFRPYEPIRDKLIELGRACVHKNHRNLTVLSMLWNGIADFARERQLRYLIGCSSLTSQEPAEGAAMYQNLSHRGYLIEDCWQTVPKDQWKCPMECASRVAPRIPKLLRAYLAIGAKVCGPPAIDRKFKTIDFLTLMDLEILFPGISAKA